MRFLSSLLLIATAFGAFAADSITMTGEDDAKAGKKLGAWMAANDFDATTLDSGTVKVKGSVITMMLSPNLTKDGLDRILVTAFFGVSDESKEDMPALSEMVMGLNAASNMACFSLDNDKDLVVQSQITFVDTLEHDELSKFLVWFDRSAFVLLTKNKAAASMLK